MRVVTDESGMFAIVFESRGDLLVFVENLQKASPEATVFTVASFDIPEADVEAFTRRVKRETSAALQQPGLAARWLARALYRESEPGWRGLSDAVEQEEVARHLAAAALAATGQAVTEPGEPSAEDLLAALQSRVIVWEPGWRPRGLNRGDMVIRGLLSDETQREDLRDLARALIAEKEQTDEAK